MDPRTKQVTVDFTVTCSDEFADGSWFVEVEQSRGGKVISGNQFGFGELGCSVEGAHESATIEASNGFFRGGAALVSVAGVACTEFECDDDFAEEEVRLSPQG